MAWYGLRVIPDGIVLKAHCAGGPLVIVREATRVQYFNDRGYRRRRHPYQMLIYPTTIKPTFGMESKNSSGTYSKSIPVNANHDLRRLNLTIGG